MSRNGLSDETVSIAGPAGRLCVRISWGARIKINISVLYNLRPLADIELSDAN